MLILKLMLLELFIHGDWRRKQRGMGVQRKVEWEGKRWRWECSGEGEGEGGNAAKRRRKGGRGNVAAQEEKWHTGREKGFYLGLPLNIDDKNDQLRQILMTPLNLIDRTAKWCRLLIDMNQKYKNKNSLMLTDTN